MIRFTSHAVAAIASTTLCTSSAAAQDYRYAIFDIPWIGGDFSFAQGVAADGSVVASSIDGNEVGYVLRWKHGRIQDNRGPGTGYVINDQHDIAGSGTPAATLWRSDGQIIQLGTLGGDQSDANGINNLGQITGSAELPEQHPHGSHAFLWENGVMTDLGTPGAISVANSINNQTQIVGWFLPEGDNTTTPFFWENGEFTVLPNLSGGRPASAEDINDDGIVIGWASVPLYEHAAKWIDGEIFDIHDENAGVSSFARCINNRGDIGGNMHAFGQDTVGFIIEAGTTRMLNLNDYLPPRRRYDITWVNDINDFGQIAGRDVDRRHGVVLSPVTPALELDAPWPGIAGRTNQITVTDATPGTRNTFLYGSVGGGTVIPGCDLQTGAALQIDNPINLGSATADQFGIASITRFVPSAAAGRTFLIQAVQPNGCKVSQLVVHQFD